MNEQTRQIQAALKAAGYDPGPIDGIFGDLTAAATKNWVAMRAAPPAVMMGPTRGREDLAWMEIAREWQGLHEREDHSALVAFLTSDHASVGDPAQLPWCGDFVETCVKLALPGEVFAGRVRENPYFARNWLDFGQECGATYGAVVVFERGPSSGHVAFLVGQDASCFYCLGGNQSDAVTVTRILKTRALGFRWPKSEPIRTTPLPGMTPGNMAISRNEA